MLKKYINKLIKHYDLHRSINTLLPFAIVTAICILSLELFLPFRLNLNRPEIISSVNTITDANFPEVLPPNAEIPQQLAKVIRPNLFKAASQLADKPMADKTIERIKSQLQLQCIMEMNGEQVAYINITGLGLKKCCVGDSVNDLFTVLNINKNSVEITIVDHKVTLNI